jgi:hypothetical protein
LLEKCISDKNIELMKKGSKIEKRNQHELSHRDRFD